MHIACSPPLVQKLEKTFTKSGSSALKWVENMVHLRSNAGINQNTQIIVALKYASLIKNKSSWLIFKYNWVKSKQEWQRHTTYDTSSFAALKKSFFSHFTNRNQHYKSSQYKCPCVKVEILGFFQTYMNLSI